MKTDTITITKKDMQAYEDVRQSGVTNMFDVKKVMLLSGLTKEECINIMENYDEYMKKYNIKRG